MNLSISCFENKVTLVSVCKWLISIDCDKIAIHVHSPISMDKAWEDIKEIKSFFSLKMRGPVLDNNPPHYISWHKERLIIKAGINIFSFRLYDGFLERII